MKIRSCIFAGIYSVKTDIKAQTLTIEGTIEPEKFRSYLKKKLHKHIDITADKKSVDSSKPSTEKKNESTEKEKPKEKSSSETTTTKIAEIQIKQSDNNVNNNSNVPYFIHYVYAPQLFSDENPNACRVM